MFNDMREQNKIKRPGVSLKLRENIRLYVPGPCSANHLWGNIHSDHIGISESVKHKDILTQFLVEAIILTVSGGLVGILFGSILSFLATIAIKQFGGISFPFSFSYLGAFLGVSVSSAIGFIFGIFPARKAAQKSPIEALRYE